MDHRFSRGSTNSVFVSVGAQREGPQLLLGKGSTGTPLYMCVMLGMFALFKQFV
jgi:hypothetical protein